MNNLDPPFCQEVDFFIIQMYAMGSHKVPVEYAKMFQVKNGPFSGLLQDLVDLFEGLGKMNLERETVFLGDLPGPLQG